MFAGCVIQAGRNEAFDHTLKTLKTSGVEQRPPVLGVPPSLPSSTLDPQSLGGRVGPTSGMFPAGRPTAALSPKLLCPMGEGPGRKWGGLCETRVLGMRRQSRSQQQWRWASLGPCEPLWGGRLCLLPWAPVHWPQQTSQQDGRALCRGALRVLGVGSLRRDSVHSLSIPNLWDENPSRLNKDYRSFCHCCQPPALQQCLKNGKLPNLELYLIIQPPQVKAFFSCNNNIICGEPAKAFQGFIFMGNVTCAYRRS